MQKACRWNVVTIPGTAAPDPRIWLDRCVRAVVAVCLRMARGPRSRQVQRMRPRRVCWIEETGGVGTGH